MQKDERIRKFNLASKIQSIYVMEHLHGNYNCILDLCAGDGEITAKLAQIGKKVYALDNDPIRVNRISSLLRKQKIDNVILNCCSAEKLPYKVSMFDVVVCNSALEHIINYQVVIEEIHRVLRPDGLLILTVPNTKMQFGTRFSNYWEIIIKLPLIIKKILCRDMELAKLDNLEDIHKYFDKFFKHEISFTEDKLMDEFCQDFKIECARYFMNFFGAFTHDCAYYYKLCDNKIFRYICLFICYTEFRFIKRLKGKGILMSCHCVK